MKVMLPAVDVDTNPVPVNKPTGVLGGVNSWVKDCSEIRIKIAIK